MNKYRFLLTISILFQTLMSFAQTARLELPVLKDGETIIEHVGFALSYNENTHCPNWVAWELTAKEVEGDVPRSKDFYADSALQEVHQVQSFDYRGSGYDRGHMCPAADMKWSPEAMQSCFYMSNICPQDRTLNGIGWERLESACRRWAQREEKVYIVCGPIYSPDSIAKTIGPEVRPIRVPDFFFKVVLSIRTEAEKAIGFIYFNDQRKQTMGGSVRTVDEIEDITGLDFFSNLEDSLESRVEAMKTLDDWK